MIPVAGPARSCGPAPMGGTPMGRRHILRNAFGLCLVGAAIAACRTAPLQYELAGEFAGRGGSAARADQIRRAGAAQGWLIDHRAPGLLRGTLVRRGQQAVVDIPYDSQRFTIRYVRSANLNYDGTNIASDYNASVQRLHRAIVAQPAT
jgi:hypothetical protein